MSGHSKWASIHRQKETQDAKRGMLFSKLSRAITIAARGGANPDTNFKLRLVIDKARASNMPKENIERAVSRAGGGEQVEEVTYEGYGPGGIAVIVEVATSNKNRTAQEMKNLFERGGGSMAGPGSVSFQFEQAGHLLVEKSGNTDEQILALIDAGASDVEESEDGIDVYVAPNETAQTRAKIEELEFTVKEMGLVMRPKNLVSITSSDTAKKTISFLESIQNHEDVQNVYANIDIPNEVMKYV